MCSPKNKHSVIICTYLYNCIIFQQNYNESVWNFLNLDGKYGKTKVPGYHTKGTPKQSWWFSHYLLNPMPIESLPNISGASQNTQIDLKTCYLHPQHAFSWAAVVKILALKSVNNYFMDQFWDLMASRGSDYAGQTVWSYFMLYSVVLFRFWIRKSPTTSFVYRNSALPFAAFQWQKLFQESFLRWNVESWKDTMANMVSIDFPLHILSSVSYAHFKRFSAKLKSFCPLLQKRAWVDNDWIFTFLGKFIL